MIRQITWLLSVAGRLTHSLLSSGFSESCFHLSLTHRMPPLFCQQGYLKQQGIPRNSQLRQRVHDAGLTHTERDVGTSDADSTFPNYLAPAGASVSSGLKLDLWLFYLSVRHAPVRLFRIATSSTCSHYLHEAKSFLDRMPSYRSVFPNLFTGLKQSSFS